MSEQVEERKAVLPPVYFLGAIACMIGLHFLLPFSRWLAWPTSAFGIVVVVSGIALAIYADGQFKRSGTTVKPFEKSSALVTDGVFAHSRNPMERKSRSNPPASL
jgi:protein-S-isoprenylcysteine O-methyltransferase Ste14